MPTPIRRRTLPLLALLPACPAPAAAEAPPTLEALMAGMAAVPERHATFREERRFAALEGVLTSTGHLRYRRGAVDKVTTWPIPERLQIEADRLVITAGNQPPMVIDAGMAPELRVLIDAVRGPLVGDAAALRRGFTATTGGTLDAWTLLLVPREPEGAKLLRQVRLEGHADQVDRLIVTQANGDEQAMTITPDPR